jgi:hypothetical protein
MVLNIYMSAIDINSPCSRVDFVKALASQLKVQVAQAPHSIPADDAQRKLQSKLDAVDQAVKSGNPSSAHHRIQVAARRPPPPKVWMPTPETVSHRGSEPPRVSV